MKKYYINSDNKAYFHGIEITAEEINGGFISWGTLARACNMVLCNDIASLFYGTINGGYIEPELINGSDFDDETGEYTEIYQYYIIDNNGVEIFSEFTDTPIYYIDFLGLYVLGVTHYGTGWAGVPACYVEFTNEI